MLIHAPIYSTNTPLKNVTLEYFYFARLPLPTSPCNCRSILMNCYSIRVILVWSLGAWLSNDFGDLLGTMTDSVWIAADFRLTLLNQWRWTRLIDFSDWVPERFETLVIGDSSRSNLECGHSLVKREAMASHQNSCKPLERRVRKRAAEAGGFQESIQRGRKTLPGNWKSDARSHGQIFEISSTMYQPWSWTFIHSAAKLT